MQNIAKNYHDDGPIIHQKNLRFQGTYTKIDQKTDKILPALIFTVDVGKCEDVELGE